MYCPHCKTRFDKKIELREVSKDNVHLPSSITKEEVCHKKFQLISEPILCKNCEDLGEIGIAVKNYSNKSTWAYCKKCQFAIGPIQ